MKDRQILEDLIEKGNGPWRLWEIGDRGARGPPAGALLMLTLPLSGASGPSGGFS